MLVSCPKERTLWNRPCKPHWFKDILVSKRPGLYVFASPNRHVATQRPRHPGVRRKAPRRVIADRSAGSPRESWLARGWDSSVAIKGRMAGQWGGHTWRGLDVDGLEIGKSTEFHLTSTAQESKKREAPTSGQKPSKAVKKLRTEKAQLLF